MSALPTYTKEEVRQHKTREDCWIIFRKKVLRLPEELLDSHPGGPIIMDSAGKDGTLTFEDNGHPDSARDMLDEFVIGKLAQ